MKLVLLAVAALIAAGCAYERRPDRPAPAAVDAPSVAELVCGENGTQLLTPVVRGRPDGVHIRVRNQNDREIMFDFEVTRGATGGGGSVAAPGASEHVIPFGAEEISIGCSAEALFRVTLRVVDPKDELKSAQLDCEAYSPDPPVARQRVRGRDPVAVARRFLRGRGLRRGDVVERAVPIAGELTTVRVVRDGRVVAAVWFDGPNAMYGIGTVETCADFAD